MKVRQCSLVSENTSLIAWIDDDPRIKIGVQVTLKDHEEPTRLWTVKSVGNKVLEKGAMKRSNIFGSIQ